MKRIRSKLDKLNKITAGIHLDHSLSFALLFPCNVEDKNPMVINTQLETVTQYHGNSAYIQNLELRSFSTRIDKLNRGKKCAIPRSLNWTFPIQVTITRQN
jgi:hypothetical protein